MLGVAVGGIIIAQKGETIMIPWINKRKEKREKFRVEKVGCGCRTRKDVSQ